MNNIISIPKVKPRELNQGGTGTAELVFTSDGTIPVVLPLPSTGQIAGAQGPARSQMGKFRVYAFGRVTGGGTTNFTPQLQYGTSATPGSNTDIESGAAVAVNSTSGFWFLEADLYVDNASGKIGGFVRHGVYGSTVTVADWTVLDNNPTSVDPDGGASLGFVVTGTFSAGFATNAAYLDGFVLELVA